MSRRRGPVETPAFAGMVRRQIRAHGRRVADADPEDLAELVAMHEVLQLAIDEAVLGMREARAVSWGQIGRALGITRQAAQQRYSHRPRVARRPAGEHPLPGLEGTPPVG